MMQIHLVILFSICQLFTAGYCQRTQYFIEQPEPSLEVIEYATAILRCKIGNQAGRVQWTKDGFALGFNRTIPGYPRYKIHGDPTKGEHHLKITNISLVDDANYQCQVGPSGNHPSIRANGRLVVLLAPTSIEITGRTNGGTIEIQENAEVVLDCVVKDSKPAATIKWYRNNAEIKLDSQEDEEEEGSQPPRKTMKSRITIIPRSADDKAKYTCMAHHKALPTAMTSSVILSVQYPPQAPTIIGYEEGIPIVAGKVQRVTCIALEGNPLAALKWFKGKKELSAIYTESENLASNELEIVATPSDNGQEYRCEASNDATPEPLVATVSFTVHFPPASVKVKVRPKRLQEGDKATLTCQSSSSNPQSNLTWWRDGFVVPGGEAEVLPGSHGGMTTRSILQIEVSAKDDGAVYTCQGTSQELGQSVHDAATLEVFYKPIFIEAPDEKISITEGESKYINMTAKANPSSITYVWTRGGQVIPNFNRTSSDEMLRVYADGPGLNLTQVLREDLGLYLLEATNEKGSTSVNININVQYPAEITQVTTPILINSGSNAFLECHVNGNPVDEETVTWQREDYDMEMKTRTAYSGAISYLTVFNVSREDTGVFECVSSNGIGEKMSKEAVLIVKFKPEIDESPLFSKSATERGSSARLTCVANGAPNVTFTWAREGVSILEDTNPDKYSFEYNKLDLVRYESVMTVSSVDSADYGPYECIARNELGFSTVTVKLDITSHPDPPHGVRAINSTHDSVLLDWQPSFDGGLPQSYRVRYQVVGASGYQYYDVIPANATSFQIPGLRLGTEYSFGVMAKNDKGDSAYTSEIVKASTLLTAPPSSATSTDTSPVVGGIPRLLIVAITIVGTALLILNIILVTCFLRKRRRKRLSASEQGSSKSATIEMYAPSTYNETVTGETLSSISEKSENYSHEESVDDYPVRKIEETGKNAASTYLIDQLEPPPSYTGFRQPDSYLPPRDRLHYTTNEEDNYADALRRNAYNQSLNEVDAYGNHVMKRSPSDINHIPPDSRYIPYPPQKYITPNGTLHHNQMSNHLNDYPMRNGSIPNINGSLPYMQGSGRHMGGIPPSPSPTQQPVLSTFGPSPSLSPSPMDNSEYEGHLV